VLDRAPQIHVDARLQYIPVGTSVECGRDDVVHAVHRAEDDPSILQISSEELKRLKSIELGHGHVQHNHLGPEFLGHLQGLTPVARKADDVTRRVKKIAGRFQEREVIIDEEDAGFQSLRSVQNPGFPHWGGAEGRIVCAGRRMIISSLPRDFWTIDHAAAEEC